MRERRTRRPAAIPEGLRVLACAALLAPAGCSGGTGVSIEAEVSIEDAAAAPAGATETQALVYERKDDKRARLDQAAAGAQVTVDPAVLAALDPSAFARLAHVTDVQIREERALLFNGFASQILEIASSVHTPAEGTKRQALQEANSAFVWLAMALTLNAIHASRPIDAAVHTGDAIDAGLESELSYFLHVASKLAMPFLDVAGNHDILTFGLWARQFPAFGLRLDVTPTVAPGAKPAFQSNQDRLLADPRSFLDAFRAIQDDLPPHGPTAAAFGSTHAGFDLSPHDDQLYYAVQMKAPAAGVPGLRLVVLETNRDDGQHVPHIDRRQLDFLNDALDDGVARESVVVVAAHHPLVEVSRDNQKLGDRTETRVSGALRRVHEMCIHYPNVVLYLCGHTHLPEISEVRDELSGELRFTQIDSGSLLIHPQEIALVELRLVNGGADIEIHARKVGPMIDQATALGRLVQEGKTAAAADTGSRPRYPVWRTYVGTRPLPAFPVSVARYSF